MASNHPRNTEPMLGSPRCGARTRSGAPCRAPAIAGATRCRMHGGKGSGAPRGNRNALRHGLYTKASLAQDRDARLLIKRVKEELAAVK
ncbi:HGGxSTG domain-containing protein [Novosphingobium sp. ZN18A2]|uniref:HGGxSTG domain-containing protein n=1 Tax=Novosphingobium sp. ZN18A2 TaxID=3079861 RepID=UPI0030D62DC6